MKRLLILLAALIALADSVNAALTLTYVTTLTSASDASSYNLGNVTAATDGLLVCVVVSRAGTAQNVSSVSIGGTNGALPVSNSGVTNVAAIATRAVTAGSHNVTVNFTGTMARCGVGVYLLTGYASETPSDTDIGQSTSSNSRALTMDFPTGGKAVYGLFDGNDSNVVWSAATENYDASPEANARFSFANKTASGAGNTETATWSAAANEVGVSAVWAEASTAVVDPLSTSIPGSSADPLTGTIPGL